MTKAKNFVDHVVEHITEQAEETRKKFIKERIEKFLDGKKLNSHCLARDGKWSYTFVNGVFIVAVKDPEINFEQSVRSSNSNDGLAVAMSMEKHFDKRKIPLDVLMMHDWETIQSLTDSAKRNNFIYGEEKGS